MGKQNKESTKVISFRVPTNLQKAIDKQAKREKKKRGSFVAEMFVSAFESHLGGLNASN